MKKKIKIIRMKTAISLIGNNKLTKVEQIKFKKLK